MVRAWEAGRGEDWCPHKARWTAEVRRKWPWEEPRELSFSGSVVSSEATPERVNNPAQVWPITFPAATSLGVLTRALGGRRGLHFSPND